MNLEESRKRIDETDEQIAKLFTERMNLVSEVAKYKKENNLPIYHAGREREVINNLVSKVPEDLGIYLKILYNTLFDVSRSYQFKAVGKHSDVAENIQKALEDTGKCLPKSPVVACQGVEGAYSQKAAEKLFISPSLMYFESFKGVFDAVDSGMCRYGVLPLENSVYGTVGEVYDLMNKYEFSIVKTAKIQVNHILAAKPGHGEITEIFSHPQAIGQCDKYLKSLKGVKVTACPNTAAAAKFVATSERTDIAAICSKECTPIYGLEMIKDRIADSDNNYTRFICISKKREIYPGADKISFMITLPHTQGSLYTLLSKFAVAGINLTKIESRPIAGRDFEFNFYFEMEVSVYSDEIMTVLSQLETYGEEFKFFGCYLEA